MKTQVVNNGKAAVIYQEEEQAKEKSSQASPSSMPGPLKCTMPPEEEELPESNQFPILNAQSSEVYQGTHQIIETGGASKVDQRAGPNITKPP